MNAPYIRETCSVEEAVTAVRLQAFTVEDMDSPDYRRRLVHCLSGGFGADWDEGDVIRKIAQAKEIYWQHYFAGHDLHVVSSGLCLYHFQIEKQGLP
jgi:hypothetical protein